ncbi:unnamed protein product, partial [Hapterophycus canaliculatus]
RESEEYAADAEEEGKAEELDDDDGDSDGRDQQQVGQENDEQITPSSDRARMELMELADCMAGDKRIGSQEALLLATLIENNDPTVMHAYNDYAISQDVSALVSTLVTIVRTHGAGASLAAAPKDMKGNGIAEKPGVGGGKQSARERVVLLMHETSVLTATDATRLLLLLAREDPDTLVAFETFESSKNVSSLVDAIKIILEGAPPIAQTDLAMAMHQESGSSNSSSLLRQILQPLPESTPRDIDIDPATTDTDQKNEGGVQRGGSDDTNNDAVAESVVGIVDSMGLDETEAVALRLAIANGDANMKGALELFRLDSDADELKDTIARVARLVLEREREAVSVDQVSDASGAIGGNSDIHGAVSSANIAAVAAPAMARNIDFTLDGKAGLFEELLDQLGRVGVMGEAQAAVIMERYGNKDAVVFAALDVYKNENDMAELVDTLKRLT